MCAFEDSPVQNITGLVPLLLRLLQKLL